MGASLLVLALANGQGAAMGGYLGFAATCFTVNMLLSSGWAEVMHPSERAVGAAAINMVANLGGFVLPYGWGRCAMAPGILRRGCWGWRWPRLWRRC
jgi:ACS family tartrate transporter-like MFS transporter